LLHSHLVLLSHPTLAHPRAPSELYPPSLHDALPIYSGSHANANGAGNGGDKSNNGGGNGGASGSGKAGGSGNAGGAGSGNAGGKDRKSTRLNSSHEWISYAVFCLKKKSMDGDAPSGR